MLVKRWLEKVLGDLADLGYDARWCVLGASDVGAPHVRKRFWLLAYSQSERGQGEQLHTANDNAAHKGQETSGTFTTCESASDVSNPNGKRDRGNVRCVETSRPAPRGGCSTIPDTRCCGSGNGSYSVCQGAEVRETTEGSGGAVLDAGHKSKRVRESAKGPTIPAPSRTGQVGNPESVGLEGQQAGISEGPVYACGSQWWGVEPAVCGVVDGLAPQLDFHAAVAAGYLGRVAPKLPSTEARIMALGNGQVPLCAATAWRILSGEFD